MTWEALKLLITVSLFPHAVAHGVALLALVKEMLAGGRDARGISRVSLVPHLAPRLAAVDGSAIWFISTTGFLIASAGF
jgi:hypothetical protein